MGGVRESPAATLGPLSAPSRPPRPIGHFLRESRFPREPTGVRRARLLRPGAGHALCGEAETVSPGPTAEPGGGGRAGAQRA